MISYETWGSPIGLQFLQLWCAHHNLQAAGSNVRISRTMRGSDRFHNPFPGSQGLFPTPMEQFTPQLREAVGDWGPRVYYGWPEGWTTFGQESFPNKDWMSPLLDGYQRLGLVTYIQISEILPSKIRDPTENCPMKMVWSENKVP